ncbi:hypothetical protein JTB14_018353 [Gonioctena quinquepunctata]|nr:hypothetical protein JTB14_018353 [Gonioctena quinquepunctata]
MLSVREFHSWKTIGEEMLSDGGSESFFNKLQDVAAESLVNFQGEDVAQIHGESITEDSVLNEVSRCLLSFKVGQFNAVSLLWHSCWWRWGTHFVSLR